MKRWLIVGFVVAAVLGIGGVLVPSGLERAFMALRDKSYDTAQDAFEKRWASGDRSREVANALTELRVRQGDVDAALDVLIAYVDAHPDDREALARIADLFRDAQRRAEYIRTLETLIKDEPGNASLLRRLEKLYDLAGRSDDRIATLRQLCLSAEGTTRDHDTLAELLAAKGQTLAALEVLYNAFRRWPGQVSADIAQTFAALAADAERDDLIRTVLDPWLANVKDPVAIDAISGTLAAKGRADLALAVATASGAFKAGVPQTVVLAARIESKLGRAADAFARLEALRAAKRLPVAGDDVYVETALRLDKRQAALDHVLSRGPQNLQLWLQNWVVAQASALGDAEFLKAMRDKIQATSGDTQAFVLGRIALALGDRDKARVLAAKAEGQAQDPASRVALAGLFADLGETAQARGLLDAAIPDPKALSPDDMVQAIPVAVVIGDGARAFAMAEVLRGARPGEMSEILYARALTATGHGREALGLLDDLDSKSEAAEAAIFEALKATGDFGEMQRRLYDLLDDGAVSQARRTNYVYMLNDTKTIVAPGAQRIVDGLTDDLDDENLGGNARLARIELLTKVDARAAKPYAKDAAQADPDRAGYIYLALLKRSGETAEAIAYLSHAIDHAKSEKTRTDFLYQWLALGVTPDVLPRLRERADSGDKAWFFATDEALKKLHMRAERLAFLTAYAQRPGLAADFKRQIAFQILDAGAKDQALALFRTLAQNAAPKSPEVEQLLFLWGPRPPAEGVAWLASRAQSARGADRVLWLERLVDSGALDRAAQIGRQFYDGGDRSVAGAYAEALALSKRDVPLRALLTRELAKPPQDAKRLTGLAQAAEERALAAEASQLYELAAARGAKTLAAAARCAWQASERARALTLFQRALAQGGDTALTRFLYGEALQRTGDTSQAIQQFERVLALTKAKNGRDDKRLRMLALARLGRFDEAEAMLGGDAAARADYASLLLDERRTARSAQILGGRTAR